MHKTCFLLLLWGFYYFLLATTTWAKVTVQLQEKVEVAEATLHIADIAHILPEGNEAKSIGQISLGPSPSPGQRKIISKATLLAALRERSEATLIGWPEGEQSTVIRKAIHLKESDLQNIINSYLHDHMPAPPVGQLHFSLSRAPGEIFLPYGELRWQVTPSQAATGNSNSFLISFVVDSGAAGSYLVRGQIEILAKVATAAVNLRKGDRITTDKILMKTANIEGLDAPFIDSNALTGMVMARSVSAGKILEASLILPPAVIREGEMITILARKGALQISTKGIAKSEGRIGETIRVKNISSNKVIYTQVTGPGTVTVEF